MDYQFRNAAFGGFNKQDVLDYLELITKENAQQLQNLQEQLDQSQTQCAKLSDQDTLHFTQLEHLREEHRTLEQTAARTQEELEQCRRQLEQAQSERQALQAQADAKLSALQAEHQAQVQALQAQVDKLLPDATAYAAVKERTAGMELEAHRRAQGVLDEAQVQAQQLRHQTIQWMQRVEREYDALRTEVESTVSHAASQLEKAQESLQKTAALMGEQEVCLQNLAQSYSDPDHPKVAAPVPIPEE